MNILYINHYAGSPQMGMEFRPYYLSREWVKMGHNVRILAGDYSHLRTKNPNIKKDFQTKTIDGIKYTFLKTGGYEGNGIKRALTMFRFVGKLIFQAKVISKKWKPDVVIASSTYPLDTYAAQRIAKFSKAKYIHEVHDMWPSTLYEVGGMSKHNPFVIMMQLAENSAYKHCDKCVSLLPYSKDYMVKHGLKPGKFCNIQNGVQLDEWSNNYKIPEEHRTFFEEHNNDFIVGYFGGHALSNALDNGLDLAKRIKLEFQDKRIIFVFVGDGVEKDKLIQRAHNENITNVYFLPPVPKESIPDLLNYFDCSYMTGLNSPLYRFGLCLNKMYDSMMAGLPVLFSFDAPDSLVKKYNCGFQFSPTDMDSAVKALYDLQSMSEEQRKDLGARGKKAILRYYTYDKLAHRFQRLFKEY